MRLTIRVERGVSGTFKATLDGRELGSSRSEVSALWAAVTAAEGMAKKNVSVRVVAIRGGREIQEFIADELKS